MHRHSPGLPAAENRHCVDLMLRFEFRHRAPSLRWQGNCPASITRGAAADRALLRKTARVMAGSIFKTYVVAVCQTSGSKPGGGCARYAALAEEIADYGPMEQTVGSPMEAASFRRQASAAVIARALILKTFDSHLDEDTSTLDNRTQAIVFFSGKSGR